MKKLVLGIDGGGTNTDIALADLEGNILKEIEAGPASLRNTGVENSCRNISKGLDSISLDGVTSTFIGLPAFAEEHKDKEEKIREILSEKIPGDIKVGSDQLSAFRSGTDSSEGVILIAGTGGVSRGFKDGKTIKVSGWGYFADEGSAVWAGIEAYRKITRQLDGRMKKSLMTEMIFEKWNLENEDDLNKKIYENPPENLPKISVIVDYAEREGDEIAREILKEGATNSAFSVLKVVEMMDLKKNFPLVIIGGMFNSSFYKKEFSKKIMENVKANIIKPEKGPVFGAVKLAIENYEKK